MLRATLAIPGTAPAVFTNENVRGLIGADETCMTHSLGSNEATYGLREGGAGFHRNRHRGQLFHFLVAWPTSGDLFISAKDLLVEATFMSKARAGWPYRDRTGFRPSLEDCHGAPSNRWPLGSVALPPSLRSISSHRRMRPQPVGDLPGPGP
jgi:hypothetical protein